MVCGLDWFSLRVGVLTISSWCSSSENKIFRLSMCKNGLTMVLWGVKMLLGLNVAALKGLCSSFWEETKIVLEVLIFREVFTCYFWLLESYVIIDWSRSFEKTQPVEKFLFFKLLFSINALKCLHISPNWLGIAREIVFERSMIC
jgi:hypothetical protein